jgi:hypothetical protein
MSSEKDVSAVTNALPAKRMGHTDVSPEGAETGPFEFRMPGQSEIKAGFDSWLKAERLKAQDQEWLCDYPETFECAPIFLSGQYRILTEYSGCTQCRFGCIPSDTKHRNCPAQMKLRELNATKA